MRLALQSRRKLPLILHRHQNSLLPFFVYWPQRALFFAWSLVVNAATGFLKEHLVPLIFVVIWTTFISETVRTTFGTILEIATIVSFLLTVLLRSYDTTRKSRQRKNERVTYSRKIDEGEE